MSHEHGDTGFHVMGAYGGRAGRLFGVRAGRIRVVPIFLACLPKLHVHELSSHWSSGHVFLRSSQPIFYSFMPMSHEHGDTGFHVMEDLQAALLASEQERVASSLHLLGDKAHVVLRGDWARNRDQEARQHHHDAHHGLGEWNATAQAEQARWRANPHQWTGSRAVVVRSHLIAWACVHGWAQWRLRPWGRALGASAAMRQWLARVVAAHRSREMRSSQKGRGPATCIPHNNLRGGQEFEEWEAGEEGGEKWGLGWRFSYRRRPSAWGHMNYD